MVRWFDPAAEETLSGEMPPRMQRRMDQLGKDLQCVMIPLSREDDVLLVRDLPSRAFQKALVDAGFDLPEITRLDQRDRLNRRKLLGFDPWAWTPDNHQLVEHLHSAVHHTVPTWHEGIRQLFRKSWATRQMAQWLENESSLPDAFGTGASLGRAVHLPSEIPDALAEFANRGYQTALVKRDLGASGRGQRRLRCDRPLTRQDWDWLQSLPAPHNQQPIAVVEPELDRLVDISFLWIMPPDGSTVKYRGWTRPLIAPNRRYAGTHLNRSFSDLGAWGDEGNRLKRWILSDRCKRLDTTAQWLEARLVPLMRELEFQGKFAVDAMVYRRRNGETTEFRIKPLVELNPRTTMGHVALELATHLAPGIQAEFRILNRAQWQPQRDTFLRPPLEKSRDGRWRSGIVLLGEINDTTQLLPVVYIGDALHLAPPP